MIETDATRIAKASTYLIACSAVTLVIDLVAFTFVARTLTQTEMGVTVALSLTVAVAHILSDLGFSSGLIKYIAEYRGRNEDYTVVSFTGVFMEGTIGGVLAVLCVFAAPRLSELLLKSPDYAFLFQLLGVSLLFSCVNTTMYDVFVGLNKIREMATLGVVATFIRQLSVVTLLLSGYGLVGLVIGWILGAVSYLIPSALMALKGKHIKVHRTKEVVPCLKMLSRFSWPLFVSAIVFFIYNWFDRALVLTFIPLSAAAVYNVAHTAFNALSIIPQALRTTLLPYYSEQYGRDSHETIIVGVHAATRYIALLFTPMAIGLMITANPTITLFAGPSYSVGDIVLAILSLMGAVASLSAAFVPLLVVYNMTPKILLINITAVGVGLVASPVLLPSLGATGMAIIRGVVLITSLVLTVMVLWKRLPLRIDKEAIWKGWSGAIVMALAVGLIQRIYFSHYLLPVYVLVGGVTYVIALRLLKAVNKNDLQIARNLVGNRAPFLIKILEKIFL